MNDFINYLWALLIGLFIPAFAAVALASFVADNLGLDTGKYLISILRGIFAIILIAISGAFVIKKSTI
ncbi:hypothetical protein [Alteromonas gracilis]|uniref:hypothetical protein n=1 Tax=Alteromonas gracilis TaxID=1479524 RepID=UPI003735D805